MIDKIDKKICTGCQMCGDICPTQAITFEVETTGFWYPQVDYNKCVKCKLCFNSCPVINEKNIYSDNKKTPTVYAANSKDDELRMNSSSGGVFGELSQSVINQGGYVDGVIFNEKLEAVHIVTNQLSEIEKMKGSKYVHSKASGDYIRIRRLLDKGKKVLFTGSPCQSAGLLSFLGESYDNLTTCDYICHGNVSPKALRKYIEMLELKYKSKVVQIHFRNKRKGWNTFGTKVVFDNGKEYFKLASEDLYMKSYLKYDFFLRPSCLDCKFKKLPRVSDLTIADYWGVAQFHKDMDDNKGTSAILINNEKGKSLFDDIKHKFNIQESSVDFLRKTNTTLIKSIKKGKNSDLVFRNIDKYNFQELIEHYGEVRNGKQVLLNFLNVLEELKNIKLSITKKNKKISIGIVTLYYNTNNYGGLLQSYALCSYLNEFNHITAKQIPINPIKKKKKNNITLKEIKNSFQMDKLKKDNHKKFDSIQIIKKFRQNIPHTRILNKCNKKYLSKHFDIYVSGGDQVWNPTWFQKGYYLDFVTSKKRKISYAASISLDSLTIKQQKKMLPLIKKFNSVSVRENTAKVILEQYGIKNVKVVLDPVFLLSKEQWTKIARSSNITQKYIFSYVIGDNKNNISNVKKISNILSLPSVYVPSVPINNGFKSAKLGEIKMSNIGPKEFLGLIKDSQLVITDSFHAVVFSIIFEKKFVVLMRNKVDEANCMNSRIIDLLNEVGLSDRIFQCEKHVKTKSVLDTIDYSQVQIKINNMKQKSIKYLLDAIK